MRLKKIMLVTFVLLAVLTIGAVSAAEDVASDDALTVVDNGDSIESPVNDGDLLSDGDDGDEDDEEDVSLDIGDGGDDKYNLSEEYELNAAFVTATVRNGTEGNLTVSTFDDYNNEIVFFNEDLKNIKDTDEYDVNFTDYYVSLNDLTNYTDFIVNYNMFAVALISGNGTVMDSCTGSIYFDEASNTVVLSLIDEDDEDDGVVLWVDDDIIDLNLDGAVENPFAAVSVRNDLNGTVRIIVTRDGDEIYYFNKSLDNITSHKDDEDYDGFTTYMITLLDLTDYPEFLKNSRFELAFFDEDDILIDSGKYYIGYDEDNNWLVFLDMNDDDGVVIWVNCVDELNLTLLGAAENPFANVLVDDGLTGNITISVRDGDDEIYFYNEDIDQVRVYEYQSEYGITHYYIALVDLEGYGDFIMYNRFKVAFVDDVGFEVDSCEYGIDFDDGVVRFAELDDDDDDEGEPLEDIVFKGGNAVMNDAIVVIPKENLPNVDDDFDVFIDDDDAGIPLNLNELDDTDEFYFIKIRDLFDEDDIADFGESSEIDMFIQFYKYEQKAYYAESEDGIRIYVSPYISGEAYLLDNDMVISFVDFSDFDDEFNVTISQEGAEDIVKTFKISELYHGEICELYLSDLNITSEGDYSIAVLFTKEGIPFAYNSGNVSVGNLKISSYEEDDEGNLITYNSIDQPVFIIKVSRGTRGFVKIFVNDTQVGGNISFYNLVYSDHVPDDGRVVALNNLNITQEGYYNVSVSVFNENGEFLDSMDITIYVDADSDSVEFYDGFYGCEPGDVIEFTIGTPILPGQYYIIRFNDKQAGYFTEGGLTIFGLYLDNVLDVKLLKPGDYAVNVTFYNGEYEEPFDTGAFSIYAVNLTSDKDFYLYGVEPTWISFELPGGIDNSSRLDAFYVYNWGPQGREDNMVFNPYQGRQLYELYNNDTGRIMFDVALSQSLGSGYRLNVGTNNIYVLYSHVDGDKDKVYGGFISFEVIEPVDPQLSVSVSDITQGESATVTVKANETFSGVVYVLIGTVTYNVTVVNGTGTISVVDLPDGNYTAYAIFNPSGVFGPSVANDTFVVKAKTVIKATAVTTTYGTSKNIVITLTDAAGKALSGKSVVVVLNGVSKTLTTDANGQAVFAVGTKLVPKTYTATITFNGDATLAKSTGSAKVVVNKAKATLTAKKKTFKKAKKSKKYTITLKAGKKAISKVKVTIIVKAKGKKIKITKKTNAKGKATFNLKKLTKKGKYTATVKFAGNKYYKAATKKAKITVK
jgi:hypothetical protein